MNGAKLTGERTTLDDELLGIMEGRTHFYRLLARVFAREADAEFLEALRNHSELLSAMRGVSRTGQGLLKDFFQRTSALPIENVALDLAVEYARLFLGAGHVQGAAGKQPSKPYASVYLSRDRFLMQEPWARIGDFYNRAGFQRAEASRELDDHISVVLEFMGHMAESTIGVLKSGDQASVREKLLLQDTFLRDYVLTWVPTLCREVSRSATSGFYKGFALITSAFVKADKQLIEELTQETSYAS